MVAYYTDSGTTTATTASTWAYWSAIGATGTIGTACPTWTTWTSNSTASSIRMPNGHIIFPTPPVLVPAPLLTPAQLAAENARREAQERRWAAERSARAAAIDRAQELLLEHLSPAQREAVKAKRFFIVEGGKSRHKYRIWTDRGVHGNIERIDARGHALDSYCVQLSDKVCPDGDHFLAQKLMLELAEDHILKIANRTSRRAA